MASELNILSGTPDTCFDFSDVKLITIKNLKHLEEFKIAWQQLFYKCNVTPFQSWEWNYEYAKIEYKNENLRIFILQNSEDVIGIAPFVIKSYFLDKIKILEFIGSRLADYQDVICVDEYKDEFVKRILLWFESNTEWHRINLRALNLALIDLLKKHNPLIEINEYDVCPYIKLDDSLFNRKKNPSRKFLNEIKNSINRLDGRINYKVITEKLEVLNYLNLFYTYHQQRIKAIGRRGNFYNKKKKEEFTNLVNSLDGFIQMRILCYDNLPICIDLGFLHNGVFYKYMNGTNTDYIELRPGYLSDYISIKNCMEIGVTIYDYMRGGEPYKYRWTKDEKKLYEILIKRKNNLIHFWILKETIKRILIKQFYRLYPSVNRLFSLVTK